MHISLVGINHRTAPVSIREKVTIGVGQLQDCLSLLHHYIPHGLILSTCNRTEVYTTSSDGKLGVEASIKFLKAHSDMPDVTLLRYVYIYQDEAVMEQLFKVACGLDSMIIGEFEVLGQVGQALEAAEPVGRRLDFLMQELNREANTLASKSADAETTKAAVELKVLIEQMREQIQNVE